LKRKDPRPSRRKNRMSILKEDMLEEMIRQIVKEEVSKDINQVKIEDAKIIVQVLLPEIDRIVTSKVNKLVRRLAMDVISWNLVEEGEEEPVKTDDSPGVEIFEKPTI
jgi:hypothetical protein